MDEDMVENEKILFYESVKDKNKIPKYGLDSIKYRIKNVENLNHNTKKLLVKLN
jgi:hypothetical protein